VRSSLGALLLLILAGCVSSPPPTPLPPSPGLRRLVYVVSHGWHVGIAVERADVAPAIWPESAHLGRFRYLEVGWGDGAFYPAPKGTLGLAIRAAFDSESSVLHVAAFDAPVTEFFAGSTIIEVPLSAHGFDGLSRFIHESYARDADGQPVAIAPGLYGHARFYRATGRYRLFDNSNHWTARALRAALCPIDPAGAITADTVLERARRFGRVLVPRVEATPTPEGSARCR
jgi:uncharacterized protein (TIGR02117 family)